VSGTDTTYSKLFGGRVGVQYQGVKAGVSGTIDEANMREVDLSIAQTTVPQAGLGDVDRYRIGADLSFDINDFFVESEIISVTYSLTDEQEAQWDGLRQRPAYSDVLGENLDQLFYYGVVGYQVTSNFDVHVLYNAVEENRSNVDLASFGGGVSYRPVFPVRLKAGYRRSTIRDGDYTGNFFSLAASVTF
jgi:opacity protein-like surface antigen